MRSTVLQLQADQLATEAGILKLRDAQLANRVTLHLAVGGGLTRRPPLLFRGIRTRARPRLKVGFLSDRQ